MLLQLMIAPGSVLAQTAVFTYQGRLLDGGQPANGSYDLRFTLANALTNRKYFAISLTNTPVTISNGLFTVTLDFGARVFNGSARWLEIGVRTNGSSGPYTLLSPRQAITATPYAAFATTAATAAVAGSLTLGAAITGNGAGIENLDGRYIQGGTINSNKLDPRTAAQLALAGTGGGGLTNGPSATNLTLWAGTVTASGTVSSPDFSGGGLHCTNLSFAPLQLAGLQSRPAMVWNSYAEFDNGSVFKNTPGGYQAAFLAKLQRLRDNGSLAAGYNIAWLDYYWGERADFNSDLTNNAVYFPSGIPYLANATHALGFRFGVYLCWNGSVFSGLQPPTTPSTTMRDIALLASWGVDAIKWDGAIAATDHRYTDRDAVVLAANCIKATGSNILMDMTLPHMRDDSMTLPPSVFPMDIPLTAQIWELSNEQELVSSVHATMIAANHFEPIVWGNGPGHCGQLVWTYSKLGVQVFTNCVNCDVMWPSPLMGDLGDGTLQYATNAEIIAIDQDPAVIPHSVIYSNGWNYIWARPLGLQPNYLPTQDRGYRPSGANAVLFINGNTDGGTASFTITSAQLKQPAGTTFLVRDPWQHANLGYYTDSFSATIAQNSTALYVLYVMPPFALAGVTNAAAPADTRTVKAWLNFTNSSDGSVYKVPLYQ